MSPRVLAGLLGALVAHGILVVILLWLPHSSRPPGWSTLQLFDFASGAKAPPVLEVPPPSQQRRTPRVQRAPRTPQVSQAPIPNQTPPRTAPAAESPPSSLGVTQTSVAPGTAKTTDTVALGNTTTASPGDPAGSAAALPAALEASPPKLIVTRYSVPPEVVGESCNIPDYAYPELARSQGIQGITQVHILVDEKGRVKKARITQSADTVLDQTALFWVESRCRFSPGRDENGKPVPSVMVQIYDWKILRQKSWTGR